MKKILFFLFIIALIFIISCSQNYINNQGSSQYKENYGLGELCSGNECDSYCYTYSIECEEYCRDHPENKMCQERFSFIINNEERPQERMTLEERYPNINKYCEQKDSIEFTSPPMNFEDISFIEPIGMMIGSHVTPTDHGYYYSKKIILEDIENTDKFVDILAPADGVISEISLVNNKAKDYRIVLHHSCTFYTIYIHVRELSPEILKETGEITMHTYPYFKIKAGELLGRAGAFDFSVHDQEITLPGFIIPEHYSAEFWKIHNVDMFEYFSEPIKTRLLEKNVRQAEPRGGKIDYDIDGKLVGNWFLEDTNGYSGNNENRMNNEYYKTHLSFAYDGLEPSLIIVSLGDYSGESKQFAVKENSPDPKDVDVSDGLVKYELVNFNYLDENGKEWDRKNFAKITKALGYDERVEGTVLVQMIEDRKIKFESFPNKKSSEVNAFADNAEIYER